MKNGGRRFFSSLAVFLFPPPEKFSFIIFALRHFCFVAKSESFTKNSTTEFMKPLFNAILSFAAIFAGAGTLRAETPATPAGTPPPCAPAVIEIELPPPPPPPCAFSREEAQLMRSLFLLSNAQLHRLGEFVRHLEKMSPERRRQMAADLDRAASEMPAEKRALFEKEMRERFRRSQENLLDRYFSTLSPEQADIEREKFLALDKKARREYLMAVREKLGLAPFSRPSEKRPREDNRTATPRE